MAVNIDKLTISSPNITNLQRIDDIFTAGGGNRVPDLVTTGIPDGTVELSVILHDPDAPMPQGFTHWVGYGLPALEGAIDVNSVRNGPNTLGEFGYVGPFPPSGHGTHHYYFWVYALNIRVEGTPTREEFLGNYAENILEQARFVATYSA